MNARLLVLTLLYNKINTRIPHSAPLLVIGDVELRYTGVSGRHVAVMYSHGNWFLVWDDGDGYTGYLDVSDMDLEKDVTPKFTQLVVAMHGRTQ